jgi:hypothetical protein
MSNQPSHANAADSGRLSPELPVQLSAPARRAPSPLSSPRASPIRAPQRDESDEAGGLPDGGITMAQPAQKFSELQEVFEEQARAKAIEEAATDSDSESPAITSVFNILHGVNQNPAAAASAASAAATASESKSGGGGGGGGGAAADVEYMTVNLNGHVEFECPDNHDSKTLEVLETVFEYVVLYGQQDEKKDVDHSIRILSKYVRAAVDQFEYEYRELKDYELDAIDAVYLWVENHCICNGITDVSAVHRLLMDELLLELAFDAPATEAKAEANAASGQKRPIAAAADDERPAKRAKKNDDDDDGEGDEDEDDGDIVMRISAPTL